MRIVDGYQSIEDSDRGAFAAIGNFDGVHLGHQVLLADAKAARPTDDNLLGVVSFEPHPRRLFQPDAEPFRLTNADEKARVLANHSVDRLYQLTFDQTMAGMDAEDFVVEVLHKGLGLNHITVGADFRFGKGRAGDSELLERLGLRLGIGVSVHELIGDESGEFASTALRQMVRDGDCEAAAAQLGRWHTLAGTVIKGDQRGRDLGYPTANLNFGEQLVPRFGIYATWVDVLTGPFFGRHAGVASIGERPTFGVNAPNFEVHLFDFTGDLYGESVSVSLVQYLRDEVRFDSVDSLILQMDADSLQAREVLSQLAEAPDTA